MDTIKDRQRLEALHESGRAPWRQVGLTRNTSRGPPDARALAASAAERRSRRVLAIGCHADDIEIGCGGTLLALTREQPRRRGHVGRARRRGRPRGGGAGERRGVPRGGAGRAEVIVHGFRDAYMPYHGEAVKDAFEELKRVRARPRPHAHARRPAPGPPARLRAHLEHLPRPPRSSSTRSRSVDGDLGRPNLFVPLERGASSSEKIDRLLRHFADASGTSTGSTPRCSAG